MAGKFRGARVAALVALLVCVFAFPAAGHFLLNVNIRILHVEHLNEGLRVFLRLPTPYVLAGLVGEEKADGTREPAPFTYNLMIDGDVMHVLDLEAVTKDPLGFGRLAAEGHSLTSGGMRLAGEVEAIRLHSALRQSSFATLEEAKGSFGGPLLPDDMGEAFVGDTVLDVQILYRSDRPIDRYEISSSLDPSLEGQEDTANLILDHYVGEPLLFRETGLLATPIAVERSALKAALGFVVEGIRHILQGTDHVLFVLCLTIGALGLGNLLWRITGFTVGHTITLIAGFFGFVPAGAWFVPAIETGIALSIIYAAAIALLKRGGGTTLIVTSLIGLLHGLGFSFVLHEILRVDAPNLWQSLLSFNLGVEVGQVAIVVLVWPLFWLLAKRGDTPATIARWIVALPCIVIAAIWSVERTLLLAQSL